MVVVVVVGDLTWNLVVVEVVQVFGLELPPTDTAPSCWFLDTPAHA